MTYAHTLFIRLSALVGGLMAPAFAFAQGSGALQLSNLQKVILDIIWFIDQLVPLIFAIAFIVFLWGVFTYFIAGGANEEKRKEGAKFVMWAVIGFVVMISIWGIVNILVASVTPTGTSTQLKIPTFQQVIGQ